jgi:hypothetical protein
MVGGLSHIYIWENKIHVPNHQSVDIYGIYGKTMENYGKPDDLWSKFHHDEFQSFTDLQKKLQTGPPG